MGGLGQDSSIFFPRFLTNGNVLILAFIPQDWKYNFMITSLLEPCLIIPNYAARHLVHSVSPTMLPEQQLARCSVCVQSPWYHRWACSPILTGYNAGTYAVVLIIQHGIVQEGVYSVSSAPAFFLQFVTQFTQTWGMERFRPCMWQMHWCTVQVVPHLHLLWERDALPTSEVKLPGFSGSVILLYVIL